MCSRQQVVDCGANIGLFTLWATSQADLAAVVAVEPMRAQFECLRRNIDLHSLKQTVRPRQLAVGSVVEEDSAFVFFPKMPSSSHRASRAAEKEGQREAMSSFRFEGATSALCRTTTLSNLISEERLPAVHLLKVCSPFRFQLCQMSMTALLLIFFLVVLLYASA